MAMVTDHVDAVEAEGPDTVDVFSVNDPTGGEVLGYGIIVSIVVAIGAGIWGLLRRALPRPT